jgi:type VI secretion system protein ImpI
MTEVTIILEHAPTPQRETRRIYHGGQLTIGRGDDADWRIEDPDMFVSRKHCVISDDTGVPTATDASTGGLFVDGATTALGAGNAARLENDMRLRMGDFVFRVEMTAAPARAGRDSRSGLAFSFEFEAAPAASPPTERPRDLPAPFGVRTDDRPSAREEAPRPPPRPFDDRDPFALDLAPRKPDPDPQPTAPPRAASWGDVPADAATPAPPDPAPATPAKLPFDRPLFGTPPQRATPTPEGPTSRGSGFFGAAPEAAPPAPETPRPAGPTPAPTSAPAPPAALANDAALRAAFYRGLGVAPSATATEDPEAEMEALGRRFRALADGLVHLLRTRAKEKQKVRVAQTIVGAANVNPLKFAVAADDAVEALLSPRGKGYLAPDDAIVQSYRDLADHQVRTWAALQTALRRMIDRFDPDEIERELEAAGRLQTLLSGGRNAKLWQLYVERYREIARAAEERFLGEVGADFRDAYEDNGRTRDGD